MSQAAGQPPQSMLWLNGAFTPIGQAAISPLDRGLLFGDGLFETLRAQDGQALWLEEHLARLQASARFLNIALAVEPPWPALVAELLERNGLARGLARVKIVLTRGQSPELGLPAAARPTLMVLAQPYEPPSPEAYREGWRLHTFRQGAAPALAGHKSLSYLYYLWARQAALEAGAQEALILDAGGLVAETATGSLLCRQDGRWWTPQCPHRLPGLTLSRMRRLLAAGGQTVEERRLRPGDLLACPTLWVLNSLMGIMPVSHLDGQALAEPLPDLAEGHRQRLWRGGAASNSG